MTEAQYGMIKSKQSLPSKDLFKVPHRGKALLIGLFGPNTYDENKRVMGQQYSHQSDNLSIPVATFRSLKTSQSISALAWNFQNEGKPKILDPSWLQLGRILRTEEGVYINLPNNVQGKPIIDLDALKKLLDNNTHKIKVGNGHIYLGKEDDFSFAPYETFQTGPQSVEDFKRGGLARLLEGTPDEMAHNLSDIASKDNYPRGINVWGFDSVQEPILRVVGLDSGRGADNDRLDVVGVSWYGNYDGYAFGGLVSGEASAPK